MGKLLPSLLFLLVCSNLIVSGNMYFKSPEDTLIDIDGNIYKTVQIGEQVWMAENLKVTHFNDGTSIPLGTDAGSWPPITTDGSTAAYCWYNNDTSYKDPYGAFYNKYTVDNGNLCPSGWHVSTKREWAYLINSLGGDDVAGGKLKEAGTEHWTTPNIGATNEVGFNALPAGLVNIGGESEDLGRYALWWGLYTTGGGYIYYNSSSTNLNVIDKIPYYKSGFSVRCVYGGDSSNPILPSIKTNRVVFVTDNSAVFQGTIVNEGGSSITSYGLVWGTNPNPTIEDNQIGGFIITGLESNTKFYARTYATNAAGTGYGEEISFVTSSSLIDIDENTYHTVKVGAQTWMAENLRVEHLNDGTEIPLIESNSSWASANSSGYCWYNNDEDNYKIPYGAIYNTYTVNTQKICPTGWRVPDNEDWSDLTGFLGGEDIAGGYLKEKGTAHWLSPNKEAMYYTGFVGLPGGYRANYDGSFNGLGMNANFWSSTQTSNSNSYWYMVSGYGYLEQNEYNAAGGLSIRCIKKETPDYSVPEITTTAVSSVTANSAATGGIVINNGGATITERGVVWSTNQNPTIQNNKTIDGSGLGSFISSMTGLQANTTYYIRAYATNSAGTGYGAQLSFTTQPYSGETITDVDGNTYTIVDIGSQTWLGENLKVKHYNDGTNIPLVTSGSTWSSLNTPAYCWYENDESSYKNPYGALYNIYAINTGKLCPIGWHVPSSEEWLTLFNYLGGADIAGGKLKETGLIHWNSPNTNATNSTNFSGLPGGYRQSDGVFYNAGNYGNWWSSSKVTDNNIWYAYLLYDSESVKNNEYNERGGFSVRCIEGECDLEIELGSPVSTCNGETETLNAGSGFGSYSWSTGATTQTIGVTETGTYSVTVTRGSCEANDEVTVTFNSLPEVDLGEPIKACEGETKILDAGSGLDGYVWSMGATTQTIEVTETGTYSVTVTQGGCEASDETEVTFNSLPEVELGGPITVCEGEKVILNAGNGNDSYLWNTGATTQSILVTSTGAYSVTVTKSSCTATDEVQVTFKNLPVIDLESPLTACKGEIKILDAGRGYDSYSWITGEITQKKEVTSTGIYAVTVTKNGCSVSDEIQVTFNNLPSIELGDPIIACKGETKIIDAGSGYDSFVWNTSETTRSISVIETGTYSVTVTKNSCENSDEIEVTMNELPDIPLEESYYSLECVTLDAGDNFDTYSWSNGANSRTILSCETGTYTVTVTKNNCSSKAQTLVTIGEIPDIDLPEAITACEGEKIELDAGEGKTSYIWSTGEITQKILVASSGNYAVTVTNSYNEQASDNSVVTFNTLPNIELGESIVTCENENVKLDGGQGFEDYIWSTDETAQTIAVNQTGTYSVTVTQNNCSSSDNIEVVINGLPDIKLESSYVSSECVNLDAGDNFDEYSWSTGESDQTIQVCESGVYTITVTNNNCSSSAQANVTIEESSVLDLPESISACEESVELDAGEGFASYLWSTGERSQKIRVTSTGTYSITVADINNNLSSDNTEVEFYETPEIELGDQLNLCEGEVYNLETNKDYDSYLWSTGATTKSINVSSSGIYAVTVTKNSCENSDSKVIYFYSKPNISLGNDTTILTNETLILSPGKGFASYVWNDGSSGESIAVQNESAGIYEYSVSVTDWIGCMGSDTISVTFNLANSITAYMDKGFISIYPNPTRDKVYINSEKPIDDKIYVAVYDLSGQLLIKREFDRLKENYDYEIDLSEYNSGMYIFNLRDNKGTKVFSVLRY